jgi:HK97 family phage prohead protease
MTPCSGKCGREGAGPYHSGDPDRDKRFTWCDECWADLLNKRMPPGLIKDCPPGTLVPLAAPAPSGVQLNSLARTEHKIMAGAECKSVATIAAPAMTGNGSFSGYLAAFGEDLQGDSIQPGAMDESVAALNAGRITWNLSDSHSEKASDIVATVTAAAIDHHGLRIEGQWGPGEHAQRLRQMVRGGQRIGLSIDYFPTSSRPDGKGGRLLDKITIIGGAVVVHPANPRALITEGKAGAWAPVVTIEQSIGAGAAAAERATPERRREDAMLAAEAHWVPQSLPRDMQLTLARGAAAAKAARVPEDDGRRVQRERYERNNKYTADLAAWMAQATICSHGGCLPGACVYR